MTPALHNPGVKRPPASHLTKPALSADRARTENDDIGSRFAAEFLAHGGIADLFFARVRHHGAKPFLHRWEDDGWRAWSWEETAQRVASLARALRELGIRDGDRVLLAAENRVEWHVSALAILAARAINVPLSMSGTADEWAEIIRNAEPCGLIASPTGANKFRSSVRAGGWAGAHIEMTTTPSPGVLAWDALVSGAALHQESPAPLDDVCCLIYT